MVAALCCRLFLGIRPLSHVSALLGCGAILPLLGSCLSCPTRLEEGTNRLRLRISSAQLHFPAFFFFVPFRLLPPPSPSASLLLFALKLRRESETTLAEAV